MQTGKGQTTFDSRKFSLIEVSFLMRILSKILVDDVYNENSDDLAIQQILIEKKKAVLSYVRVTEDKPLVIAFQRKIAAVSTMYYIIKFLL